MTDDPRQMTDDPQASSCIEEANIALQRVLRETCEMPLGQLRDLAADHGVRPIDLLARIDGADGCFLDYGTGHVRCTTDPVDAPGLVLDDDDS